MVNIVNNKQLECTKCKGRVLVDRVFLSYDHLELYCMVCGKRWMYNHPDRHGEIATWIMKAEKTRAKAIGNSI
jgi:hypothetical protein